MLRALYIRYRRISLQWRIMFYVTAGLVAFLAIYGIVALQAIHQASNLVFYERLAVARSFAREIDARFEKIQDDAREPIVIEWSSANNTLLAQSYLFIGTQVESLLSSELEDYRLELLNESGIVVYSHPSGRQFTSSPHWRIVEPFLRIRAAGTDVHRVPNGEHVVAFAPLEHTPWILIIEQSGDAALALPRQLQERFLGFAALAIIGGLILAFVTTRRVVEPVNALIRASQELARGNLDHPLDVSGEGEIGTLARAFAEMRSRLRESAAEIARWSRDLEARVDQRTRELRALVESSHALSSTLYLDTLFEILIREARGVLPAIEGIALFLFDRETELLIVHKSFGFEPRAAAQLQFRIGEGIAGRVFETEQPFLLTNAVQVHGVQTNFSYENRRRFADAIGNRAVQSALGVPLISKGSRVGALMTYNFSGADAFNSNDVSVLQAFADQAAAAIENARLYAELQKKEELRAHLLEKVIEAQEEERKRIARELHDELAQTLTALTIDLETTARHLPPEFANLKERLLETEGLTTQTLKEVSQLILELRPSALDDLGLVPAIRRYAENRLEPRGAKVHIESNGLKHRLPSVIETTLFRIAQETINNAGKYAQARNVHIRLRQSEDLISLEVEDDGAGFEAEDAFRVKDNWRGLGLLGMRERAALLGGTLTIESKAKQGTRVRAEIPSPLADEK